MHASAPGVASHPSASFRAHLRWLLDVGPKQERLESFVDGIVVGLRTADVPLDRVALHLGALHPRLPALDIAWSGDAEDPVNRVSVREAVDAAAPCPSAGSFRCVRVRPGEDANAEHPFCADLRSEGLTDCVLAPLALASPEPSAALWATQDRRGFTSVAARRLERLTPFLARSLEAFALRRLCRPLASTRSSEAAASPNDPRHRIIDQTAKPVPDFHVDPELLFTRLELTVIALARREALDSVLNRFSPWKWSSRARPLANPRLEALRVHVEALVRGADPAQAADTLHAAGFTPTHSRSLAAMAASGFGQTETAPATPKI